MLFNISKNWKAPEVRGDDLSLARNPFWLSPENVEDQLQDQLIDLKNDSSCRDLFQTLPVTEFG